MGKIAIVIGATGLVGRALVEELLNAAHISQVITLTRTSCDHQSLKVVNHVIDFTQLNNYAHLFQGDLLFSCLGTTIKQAGSLDAQRKVDLDYQYQAAKMAADNGVLHYLLVSSFAANPHSQRGYLKMKGQLEQQIKALPFDQISIFQPSLLQGPRSDFRVGEKLATWLMMPLSVLPVIKRYRPISGEQVAKKMVAVSAQPAKKLQLFCLDQIFS